MYSSFPARESLGLISYVTASQLLGLSPRTHFCYFLLIMQLVFFANAKIKKRMLLRFCLYSTITPGYLAITFLLTALPLDCLESSREFPIRTLFRFPFLFIIQHVHFANAKIKKRKDCGLASTAILNFWLCDRLMTLVH